MLNAKNVKKLITALRSGKYMQARARLRRDGINTSSFCCLGVACDLYAPDKWKNSAFDGQLYLPPIEVRDHYGFSGELINQITEMNDLEAKTFEEIADFLEERLNA